MKKLLALLLVALMLVGCGSKKTEEPKVDEKKTETQTETQKDTSKATGFKLGLGNSVSLSAKEPSEDKPGSVTTNTTYAALLLDDAGKIVKVLFDVAQNKTKFTKDGFEAGEAAKTKLEKLEEYGMKETSPIKKEWYEQTQAFEKFCVGKTVADVLAIKVKEVNGHKDVADVPELTSSCTISLSGFFAALKDAETNLKDVANVTDIKFASVTNITAKEASDDKPAKGQVDTTFGVVAIDANQKIAGAIFDVTQSKFTLEDGKAVLPEAVKSKKQLKEGYGMKEASPIKKEWFEQAQAFEDYCVGKTAAEVLATKVKEVNNHKDVADVPELTSSCTISLSGFFAVLQKTK